MKPFQNTALLRPLTIEELRLEDPEWVDDHTITFYIPVGSMWIPFLQAFMWKRIK